MKQIHTGGSINFQGVSFPTFDYVEYDIKGAGRDRVPLINMDKYIDHSQDEELHRECCIGLSKVESYHMSMFWGALPPEVRKEHNNKDSWSEMIRYLDQYDPTGFHRTSLEEIVRTSEPNQRISRIFKYAYFSMGAVIPWFFDVHLKKNSFYEKAVNGEWTHEAQHFPKLIKYLETLPFKSIGRVLFFTTYPNSGVAIHRDSYVEEHKDHNINLFFTGGDRPSFIWDAKNKEKIYLEKGARSYFFNNRDYHGVDPESSFRYTLRVDGIFTDELQKELGLEDGYVWRWDYTRNT